MKIWGFSTSLILNFQAPKQDSREIREIDFGFLKMDFMIPNPKFEIEIMVLGCEILILDDIFRIEIFEKSKCEISNFGRILVPFRLPIFKISTKFIIFGVYIHNFSKISSPGVPENFVRQIFLQL